jgi:predicted DNA-binding transcriptional regulator AlpA
MPTVLTSWKDISQYVGKAVRTIQRWERELHFPIRRVATNGRKTPVFAIPSEIDQWSHSHEFRNQDVEVETLRREIAALRLENALLRQQLDGSDPARAVEQEVRETTLRVEERASFRDDIR